MLVCPKYYLSFVVLFFITAYVSFAQNPDLNRTNHWYFGQKAGLDFSSGTAVSDTNGKMTFQNRCSVISDKSGILLFYSDGKTVWNAQHDTMLNGFGIGAQYSTSIDGSVIIPKPGNSNIYYIFVIDGWENQWQNGLSWTEVDMTLDGGKGAVISKKNILFAPATEQLAATKNANGCDYWVTVHEHSTAKFRSYLVTASGIDTVPVISIVGTDYGFVQQIWPLGGGTFMAFSPNGSKLVSNVSYSFPNTQIPDTFEFYNFDNSTGVLNNPIQIPIDSTVGSAKFSPNSQLLYMEMGYWHHDLFQFDVSSGVDSIINNSKTLLYTSKRGIANDYQIGRDGKMYLCDITFAAITSDSLSIINYPDVPGIGCNLQARVFPLFRKTTEGFDNFVSNFVINDSSSICTTGINDVISEAFEIYPNPANDFVSIICKKNTNLRNFEFKIFDFTGRLIVSNRVNYSGAKISTRQFTNGIYLIKILCSNKYKLSQKIIIQH